jgi:hypothetical protein
MVQGVQKTSTADKGEALTCIDAIVLIIKLKHISKAIKLLSFN